MKLKKGDRVRMKVRTMGGWKGYGTVLKDQITHDRYEVISFEPDGRDHLGCGYQACRCELAKLRSQKP